MANKLGNAAGLGLILFTSLAPEGGRITLNGREPIFYYGTIMPIIIGLISAIIISSLFKLKKPERVTVAVECVYQNTGIAMTSVLALFPDLEQQQRALAVPFWYTAWKMGWTKAPANENIIKVILQSYEVNEEISDDEDAAQIVPESVNDLELETNAEPDDRKIGNGPEILVSDGEDSCDKNSDFLNLIISAD
eukprot:scaffold4285_cov278-Chaetoceros_neogracile.AAC.5